MAVNYKSLTTLKSDMFASNRQVEPVEEIRSYYGIDNIDLLGLLFVMAVLKLLRRPTSVWTIKTLE